jgi:hypothetical protein
MGSLSWIHWFILLIVLIGLLSFFIPVARILQRAGFSPWWVLLGLVPGASLVGYWVFAFIPWPALERNKTDAESQSSGS